MSWSYSGNPANSSRDAVRFNVGDTIETDPLVTDEEIDYLLTLSSNIFYIAAQCCDAIASKFARKSNKQIGKTRIDASKRAEAYERRAAMLYKKASSHSAPISTANPSDAPYFVKGVHDYGQ